MVSAALFRQGAPQSSSQDQAPEDSSGGAPYSSQSLGSRKRPWQCPPGSNPRIILDRQGMAGTAPKQGRVEPPTSRSGINQEDLEEGEIQAGHEYYDPLEEDDESWVWPRHLGKYAALKF